MRTPADFFRKHQRILLPAITGLAILAFIVQDASGNDIQGMPPILVVVTLAVLCGGAAWIAGTGRDKGSEYGLVGVIVGVLLALVVNTYRKEGPILSREEQIRATKEIQVAGAVAQFGRRTTISDPNARHALLEEARAQGVHLEDSVGGWQMKNAGMTRKNYDAIKKHFQVTDALITDALRKDAEASLVARGLFGDGIVLASPADWWDAYQKLNVRQSAQVVPLPVEQFIDPKAEPKEADLVTLFEEYRRNIPGYTSEGRSEEGRPGFFQLPRVKASYLMANVQDFAAFVPQPTDEEVEARYKEQFAQPLPPRDGTGPVLPIPPEAKGNTEPAKEGAEAPKNPDAPKPDAPKAESPKEGAPKAESPEKPAATPPADPAKGKGAEEKAPASPEADQPASDKPTDKPAEEPKSSEVRREDGTVEVAAIDEPAAKEDAKPAEPAPPAGEKPAGEEKPAAAPAKEETTAPPAPATEKPATEKPAAEKPATENPEGEKPADGKPAEPATDPDTPPSPPLPKLIGGSSDDDPLPPSMKVVPLDDELRAKLKEEIIEERAEEIIRARCDQAVRLVQQVLDQARAPKASPKPGETPPAPPEGEEPDDVLTPEQAKAAIEKIANDLNLELVETPLISELDIEESKDSPLKNASVPDKNWRDGVLQALFAPGSPLNTVVRGSNAASKVEMAIWKTEESPAHEPKSLDDVRDQVVKTWRIIEARKVAEKRAAELVALAKKEAGKPLGESLRDATVTGEKDSLLVEVTPTGSFSWLIDLSFGMQFSGSPPPRIGFVGGVDKPGEGFMKTVFQELKPGDIGTAFNSDKSVCYVVQIESRDTAKPEEMEKLRDRFVKDRQNADVARAAAQQMAEVYRGNPYERVIPPATANLIDE